MVKAGRGSTGCGIAKVGLLLVAIAASGCSRGPKLSTGEGVVYLDGQPLAGAVVEFQPDTGSPSTGLTDETGRFSLKFSRNRSGVLPGMHTVRISTERTILEADGSERDIPERIPTRYNHDSELKQEVQAGRNEFEFKLDSTGKITTRKVFVPKEKKKKQRA